MKTFKVEKTDDLLKSKGYKYNVKVLIDGVYCGIGRYCRDKKEVDEYIKEQEKSK